MTWQPGRFDTFVEATVKMARGQLQGYGYPHVVMPYDASDEVTCIDTLRQLPATMHAAGFSTLLVPVAQEVSKALREYADAPIRAIEDAGRIEADASTSRDDHLALRVANRIKKQLQADTQVLVLARLGALHPFSSVSGLLDALYRVGVRCTIAAAYPGSVEGVALRFLGVVEPHGGYRGHIVA